MRRPVPYVVATAAGVVVIMLAYLVVRPHGGTAAEAGEPVVAYGPCQSQPIGVTVAVSPEKRDVMATLATRYNTSSRLFDGRCARVDVFAESSGVTMESLAGTWNPDEHATKPRPQVWIPASSAWLVLLAQRGPQVKLANADKAGRFPSVAKSPLVLAVPKSIADQVGGTIGWSDLLRIAGDGTGWRAAHPGTGAFKLGKTNPNYSTSGLHATIATYEAVAAARGIPLNQSTVDDPRVRGDVGKVENTVVHYGETTLSYLTNLAGADAQGHALSYVSAVAVEEKSVSDYNQGRPDGDLNRAAGALPRERLVALYPSDGTLVSDHPYSVLSTASDDQRLAAHDFLRFLLDPLQQKAFKAVGLRGADGKLAADIPGDRGIRPDAKIRELPLPAPAVLAKVLDSWKQLRKPARVLLALDVSGSMGEDPFDTSGQPAPGHTKLDLVKAAAKHALDLFSPQDQVGLWSFSGNQISGSRPHTEQVPVGPFSPDLLRARIDALKPDLSTALYTTIRDAYDLLAPGAGPDTITALVVLTDGKNEWNLDNDLDGLRRHIDATGKDYPVRVFTVAYGHDADGETLTGIARSAAGWGYDATDPRSIDQVMRNVISNF